MQVIKTRQITESCVEDVLCNKCEKSCKTDCGGLIECATLLGDWGYGSKKDGTLEEIHFCESCYDDIVDLLKLPPTDLHGKAPG